MIKKLKIKFILLSMVSVLFVLSVTIAVINISNYNSVEKDGRKALSLVLSRGVNDNGKYQSEGAPPPPLELMTEHYFVVGFNADGSIFDSDFVHIFTITKEYGEGIAKNVLYEGKGSGKIDNFRYQTSTSNGITYVAFVDLTDEFAYFHRFLITSTTIASGCYILLFLLILLASKLAFLTSEESYRKQKSFITNASHELKTPLTIISTDIEIIEMDYGKNEWTESIRDQINRLSSMTTQLVTLSRLDEGDVNSYPFSEFNLSSVAKECVDSFTPSLEKDGFKLISNIEGDINYKGNKYLLNEIFYIFLDNAHKYAKSGGEIEVDVAKIDKKVSIVFKNDIADSDNINTKLIFDRFYRSENQTKPGSGIGLSIANEIIKLHKGKVSASIENNKIIFSILF